MKVSSRDYSSIYARTPENVDEYSVFTYSRLFFENWHMCSSAFKKRRVYTYPYFPKIGENEYLPQILTRHNWRGSHLRLFAKRMFRKCKKPFSPPFPRTKNTVFCQKHKNLLVTTRRIWRICVNAHSHLSCSLFVLGYSWQRTISVTPA